MKLTFKQENITKYFKHQGIIDFEVEMKRIERERLLDLKRRKELEWQGRRELKKKEVTNKVAKEIVDNIAEEAWRNLEANKMEKKIIRLEKAAFCTLTARTSNWRITDPEPTSSPKRKRGQDWHTGCTTLKKIRGWGGEGPSSQTKPVVGNTPPPAQPNKKIEEKPAKGGPKKSSTPPKKMPQVKTRKWMKGKNGLYRWVTSLKSIASIEPTTKRGPSQSKETFGNGGTDGSAAVIIVRK